MSINVLLVWTGLVGIAHVGLTVISILYVGNDIRFNVALETASLHQESLDIAAQLDTVKATAINAHDTAQGALRLATGTKGVVDKHLADISQAKEAPMIPERIFNKYPEFENPSPLLREAMKTYGVLEWLGEGSNPLILGWAGILAGNGYEGFRSYTSDAQPWCSLWMSWVAYRADYTLPHLPGWSQSWKKFGDPVEGLGSPGDVAVFVRPDPAGVLPPNSLGHVGVVVRALPDRLHIIGGNQSDQVSIIVKSRASLVAVRRPPGVPNG